MSGSSRMRSSKWKLDSTDRQQIIGPLGSQKFKPLDPDATAWVSRVGTHQYGRFFKGVADPVAGTVFALGRDKRCGRCDPPAAAKGPSGGAFGID